MLTLIISHNIYLTRDERYELASGKDITVVGISIPVWFYKGNTSEPAPEIYCKYMLSNKPNEYPVCTYEQGYKINLQQIPQNIELKKKPKNWNEYSLNQRIEWYKRYNYPISGNDLLDVEDGGLEFLQYNHYNKIVGINGTINATHVIHINKLELLLNSFD